MTQTVISLRDVSLSFSVVNRKKQAQTQVAINRLNLDIMAGEALGIVGHNGCGKSTLLKLIAGIHQADSGLIERGNQRIALLSLGVGFDPELSGVDNIILSGMFLGFTRQETRSQLQSIMAFSELGEDIYRPVKTFSAGMRTRLGFSIAIKLQPDILLIDETLSVGDQHFQHKAEETLAAEFRACRTVVLVSHLSEQIRQHCDRVLWLDHGQAHMLGETQNVMDAYLEASN